MKQSGYTNMKAEAMKIAVNYAIERGITLGGE